ncbi:GNAT family N-acetyltransferase [Shewanella aestuarii]|uniref:GNAT family N-acetyltransferase n=1 Tax=Shewanella aestuarii TaxID=1028752 RepID=A0A6G9QJ34_9GAMM|nr:GNAT family N-acetyltransferase [Shewanella aestuarii]QIR13891.1 GNAT family N-acetyltransferase [Shewanella aestuarii]
MFITEFTPAMADQISQLYHQAIQQISHPRYNQSKKTAWSKAPRSKKYWQIRLRRNKTWVMINEHQQLIGFISVATDFTHQGYIEYLYVSPQYQQQGIASALLRTLQTWCQQQSFTQLSVDASYLSRPIFEKAGFTLCHPSYQRKLGQTLNGFLLTKPI